VRVVVLGTGLLGDALLKELAHRGHPHASLDHAAFDATGSISKAAARLVQRGDLVINAAAMTNLDACEERRAEAMEVNGEEPGRLATLARERGAKLLHVSTDNVLDVVNVYAEAKALGEKRVREALGDEALIVRVSTVFGPHPRRVDFVRFVVSALREKGEVTAITDMLSSPTYTPDAARALLAAGLGGAKGTHAFVNEPCISRYDWALDIQRAWGAPGVVKGAKMDDFKGWKARRPKGAILHPTLGAWHEPMPLAECMREYKALWP